MNELIADDFVEYGASGRVYDKESIIQLIVAHADEPLRLDGYRVRLLSETVALATYRIDTTLRSSVWRNDGAGWRIVFHQGTRSE